MTTFSIATSQHNDNQPNDSQHHGLDRDNLNDSTQHNNTYRQQIRVIVIQHCRFWERVAQESQTDWGGGSLARYSFVVNTFIPEAMSCGQNHPVCNDGAAADVVVVHQPANDRLES